MRGITACLLVLASVGCYGQSSLSITDFGATGDDTTNDTTAIVNTISAAASQGKSVLVPAGTFYHTNFTLNGVDMAGVSNQTSILHAFDPVNNTVLIIGNGVSLSNIQLTSTETVRTAVDWPLFIDHATNFTIDRIIIDGGNSGGMIIYGGQNGIIINNEVKNTLADGIHNTEGANGIIVANNKVRSTGDDMIAVVSYAGTVGERAFNILIQDNDVGAQVGGRGLTTVGGSDITIQGNIVDSSRGAGVLIATEPAFTSPPLSNVLVQNNTLSNNATGNSHAAILISALNGLIDTVRLESNSISQPLNQSIRLEGTTSDTAIINNTMVDAQSSGILVNSGQVNVFCSGNTMNGSPNTHANCTGANNFTVTGSSLTYNSPCPGIKGICPAGPTGSAAITLGGDSVQSTGTVTTTAGTGAGAITEGAATVQSSGTVATTIPGNYSFAIRNAQANSIEPVIGPRPVLRLCSGPIPSSVNVPDGGQSLVKFQLPANWATPSTAAMIGKIGNWEGISKFSGTLTHFRLYGEDGTTPFIQGSVTALGGGGVITIPSQSVQADQKIRINSFNITLDNAGAPSPVAPHRLQFSTAIQNTTLDLVESVIGPSAVFRLFAGALPASVAAPTSGLTVATMALPANWLTDSAGGIKTKLGTWQDPDADAAGIVTHGRFYDQTGTNAHLQLTVTDANGNGMVKLQSVSIGATDSVTISTVTFRAANQ